MSSPVKHTTHPLLSFLLHFCCFDQLLVSSLSAKRIYSMISTPVSYSVCPCLSVSSKTAAFREELAQLSPPVRNHSPPPGLHIEKLRAPQYKSLYFLWPNPSPQPFPSALPLNPSPPPFLSSNLSQSKSSLLHCPTPRYRKEIKPITPSIINNR